MKIIPAIDLMNGEVVRLFKGDPKQKTVYSNNPVEIAKKWEDAGADMLHIVDLVSTGKTLKDNNLIEVEEIARISTRLVVNRNAMKTSPKEINTWVDLFSEGVNNAS